MITSELVTAVQVVGRLSPSDVDNTTARIRQELNDALQSVFGHLIVQSKSGAWLKQLDTTTTANRTRYRLPHRAAAGIGDSIEILTTSGNYQILGDQMVFDVAPAAGETLRVTYYLRPSALVTEQTDGAVTAVNATSRTVTVNVVPDNQSTGASLVNGDTIDIVHPNGWHELSIVNVVASLSGLVFTLPEGTDMTDIEIGDYVRAAGQTDWPCIPDDFHRLLVDLTASRILRSRGYLEKAALLERQAIGDDGRAVPGGDLARFADSLSPRIKDTVETCVPQYGVLRSRGGYWSRGIRVGL